MKCVIADTGPLVALLDRQDQDHEWAVREGRRLPLWPDAPVFTLDSDFRVYRRNKRQSLPLLCP